MSAPPETVSTGSRRPMLKRVAIVAMMIVVGGCEASRDSDAPASSHLASLPGMYSGVFPCDGCPGIPATLWLRSDGRFFFEQNYPAVAGREAMDAYGLGRWTWDVDERIVLLQGSGPERRFVLRDANTLIMRTDSSLEHRLDRDAAAREFTATIIMLGMMQMRAGNARFTECLTGLDVPVSRAGEFSRLRHQFRSASVQGGPVAVELEGHFSWARDGAPESLTIDRLITVKAEGGC